MPLLLLLILALLLVAPWVVMVAFAVWNSAFQVVPLVVAEVPPTLALNCTGWNNSTDFFPSEPVLPIPCQ